MIVVVPSLPDDSVIVRAVVVMVAVVLVTVAVARFVVVSLSVVSSVATLVEVTVDVVKNVVDAIEVAWGVVVLEMVTVFDDSEKYWEHHEVAELEAPNKLAMRLVCGQLLVALCSSNGFAKAGVRTSAVESNRMLNRG